MDSYTFLTTTPNEPVAGLGHSRTPVLLTNEQQYADWLDPERVERCELEYLFKPFDAAGMLCYAAK